jgi:hypothetical protein
MMAALLRGATIDTILSSFTCEGSPLIRDALVIPTALDDALVARLGRTPDELHCNWLLFAFLSYRSSDAVFVKVVEQFPGLLRRTCWRCDLTGNDPQIATYARAHHLNVLPDDLRSEVADKLESSLLSDFDASFFDEPQMLAIMPPLQLIGVGMALRTAVLTSLEERIDEIVADADLDEEPDSHFRKILDVLDHIEALRVDADATAIIDDARDHVKRSIEMLEERKREHDEGTEDEADWTHLVTQDKEDAVPPTPVTTERSVFDDVDK